MKNKTLSLNFKRKGFVFGRKDEEMNRIISFSLFVLLASGCATTKDINVDKGMAKTEVEEVLGSPKVVNNSKNSCCWEKNQEAWYYFNGKEKDRNKGIIFEDNVVKYVFVDL